MTAWFLLAQAWPALANRPHAASDTGKSAKARPMPASTLEDPDSVVAQVARQIAADEAAGRAAAAAEIAKRPPRLNPDIIAAQWAKVPQLPRYPLLSDPAFARYRREVAPGVSARPEELANWYPI